MIKTVKTSNQKQSIFHLPKRTRPLMLGHLDEKIKTFLSASFVQKGDVVNTLVVTHCVKSVQIRSFSGPYLGTFHAVIVIAKALIEKSDYEHLFDLHSWLKLIDAFGKKVSSYVFLKKRCSYLEVRDTWCGPDRGRAAVLSWKGVKSWEI